MAFSQGNDWVRWQREDVWCHFVFLSCRVLWEVRIRPFPGPVQNTITALCPTVAGATNLAVQPPFSSQLYKQVDIWLFPRRLHILCFFFFKNGNLRCSFLKPLRDASVSTRPTWCLGSQKLAVLSKLMWVSWGSKEKNNPFLYHRSVL